MSKTELHCFVHLQQETLADTTLSNSHLAVKIPGVSRDCSVHLVTHQVNDLAPTGLNSTYPPYLQLHCESFGLPATWMRGEQVPVATAIANSAGTVHGDTNISSIKHSSQAIPLHTAAINAGTLFQHTTHLEAGIIKKGVKELHFRVLDHLGNLAQFAHLTLHFLFREL